MDLLSPSSATRSETSQDNDQGTNLCGTTSRPDAVWPSSVAFLSTMLPQKCGLATFTADLMAAVHGILPDLDCVPVTIADNATDWHGVSDLIVPRHVSDLIVPRHVSDLIVPRHVSDLIAPRHVSDLIVPPHVPDLIVPPHVPDLIVPPHVPDLIAPKYVSDLIVPKHGADGYRKAAIALNAAGVDVLCVQHEYGIFGGPDGALLLDLVDAAAMPVVVTLHTVLERPSPTQFRVMQRLLHRASRVVVMTQRSAGIVASVHGVGPEAVCVVPHGIPLPPREARETSRLAQSMQGRPTLLTFGLLSPGKGIEHVIRALPELLGRFPDILYVVMGATHPNLVRDQGEDYREGLMKLAAALGVAANVRFVNRFVDLPELMQALNAADIYVTAYLNEAQAVSGTLSYSYGIGTPVISTPYYHAAELLADGRGVLVPFADPGAIAAAVTGLFEDPRRLADMRRAARIDGQRMLWPNIGARYLEIFREAMADQVPAAA